MNPETRFDIFIELTDTKTDKLKLKTKMTEASSIEMADEVIFASYVRFCRDVARKPVSEGKNNYCPNCGAKMEASE